MAITETTIHKCAIKWLFRLVYKTDMEHEENRAIELFDKLLARGHSIQVDEITKFCVDAGFDEAISKEITKKYEIIQLYHQVKKMGDYYWDEEMIQKIEQGENPH
ncbi:MAG: hypothetical protein QQN41_08735 [Nitrosopumilus sp.]